MSYSKATAHTFHAEAHALLGDLQRPFKQSIEPQALAKLHPSGGYLSQSGIAFRAEGIIGFSSASTQVAGVEELKNGFRWATLSTAVVENLHIAEVVTADRIVSQNYTKHPDGEYVPAVTFLGTRYENLQVGGFPVKPVLNLDLLGGKPPSDAPYTSEPQFTGQLQTHFASLVSDPELFQDARKRYTGKPVIVDVNPETSDPEELIKTETIECSLVTSVSADLPWATHGHVIYIPDLGEIHLATLRVMTEFFLGGRTATTIELKMIEAKLGCVATGTADVGTTLTEGPTKP